MVAHSGTLQRIVRLTPLGEVLPMIAALAKPVSAQHISPSSAFGAVLAHDVSAAMACPAIATAIRDGWAVNAAGILDASALTPVPLAQQPAWLETGDPVPDGMDTVAPLDAVDWHGEVAEAVAPVAPGEGVLAASGDAQARAVLYRAGRCLRSVDVAILAAVGSGRIAVRMPRIGIMRARATDKILDPIVAMLGHLVEAVGGIALAQSESRTDSLESALNDEASDAVIVVGGTGSGRRDAGIRTLERVGRVAVHGIAISPGETAAFGDVEGKPVLLVPGRIDAAIAAWLLLGKPLMARMTRMHEPDVGFEGMLARKVASNLGLSEVIPVRRTGNTVEPLASGYLSLTALAQADGWILVPPDSEGYPAGARVTVRPLP